jgi:type VI secretion system secreted protein VgrG
VQFLGGDPDRPVVIGRLYTEMNPPPDKLPGFKHVSGIMSESTPRLIMGGAGEPGASAPDSILGGGKPMSPEEIASEVQGNGPYAAKSPTGAIHEWPGSGIKFSDADGQQSIYLQAQKDLNITVNNAWRTIVKADRSCKVGSDDILEVGGRHVVIMKGNQTVEIKGEQYLSTSEARAEEIQGTMSLDVDKSFECTSDLDINYTAKQLLSIEAKNRIELVSKGGSIVLTKDSIVVTAADVFVQPGEGGFKKGK